MQTPPPLPGKRLPDWMARNWKWFVPLLCLVALAGIGGFITLVLTLMKSSDAYSGALVRAESSPAVIAVLGTPIKDGFFFSGNISENNSSGSANLAIPISGPNGTADLYVSASRSSNKWHFNELVVEIDKTKQRIDILDTNQLPVTTSAAGAHSDDKQ
jgi:Cytochrome oxidase complex assembly protein 1